MVAASFEGDDYIVSWVTPEQVKDEASALEAVAKAWSREQPFSFRACKWGRTRLIRAL